MQERSSTSRRRWIWCGVTAVALAALVTGSVVAASAAAPVNTKEPSLKGSALVGKDLTGNAGTWTGAGISYAYRWLRCDKSAANCVPIAGAIAIKYKVTSTDLGATIRFEVTGSNTDGKGTATSNPTTVITTTGGIPASSTPPTIGGTATVGATLTSTDGTWVGDQPITYSYQWQHCDANGNACKDIAQATHSSTKLTDKEAGFTIRIEVSARNSRGTGKAFSLQTALVQGGGSGGGIINLPGGGKSVDVKDVPAGERLIVESVAFNPNPVRSRTQPSTVTITVKDTRGYFVRNAFVFIRSTPILTSTPTDAQTAVDGKIAYAITPRSDFPLRNGYNVQFFVKAYRKGDPTLAGISGSRLVQVATAT